MTDATIEDLAACAELEVEPRVEFFKDQKLKLLARKLSIAITTLKHARKCLDATKKEILEKVE